jgi:flagellar basal-body rod protein FlgF
MSFKGIYAALSGSLAQSLKIDTIANNIANVNTTGFKKDQQTFGEYLTSIEKQQQNAMSAKTSNSLDSVYNINGTDKSFVDSTGTYTNFEQGSLKHTGGKLDIAIDGEGFFEVETPQGIRLTRAGNFTVSGDGQLVNKDGHAVVVTSVESESSEENVGNTAQFSQGSQPHITDNGDVYDGQKKIGRLSIVKVENPDSLQKIGNNNYDFKPNMNSEKSQIQYASLKQGYLETSNVNIVAEMTDMIMAQRVFEGTQKAIQAYDQMEDKLINQVGNTKG